LELKTLKTFLPSGGMALATGTWGQNNFYEHNENEFIILKMIRQVNKEGFCEYFLTQNPSFQFLDVLLVKE
jgi:hypothetical protein